MKNRSPHQLIPSWSGFEISVHEVVKLLIPRGDHAGFIRNVRLGHDRAHEADLLYAGTINCRKACVIIECKNRPIVLEGSRILLPNSELNSFEDISLSLQGKINDAQQHLNFEKIRILVVGSSQDEYISVIREDLVVVSFSNLEEGWRTIASDIEPIIQNSPFHVYLKNLPRFNEWHQPALIKEHEQTRRQELSLEEIRHLHLFLGNTPEFLNELEILREEIGEPEFSRLIKEEFDL